MRLCEDALLLAVCRANHIILPLKDEESDPNAHPEKSITYHSLHQYLGPEEYMPHFTNDLST